jgi:hypothetical protein
MLGVFATVGEGVSLGILVTVGDCVTVAVGISVFVGTSVSVALGRGVSVNMTVGGSAVFVAVTGICTGPQALSKISRMVLILERMIGVRIELF